MKHEIWLVRHGETAWSLSGQHTGWTDLALKPGGEQQALGLGSRLGKREFRVVFSSPLQRARKTCELAGYGGQVVLLDDLREWNYGSLEGRTAQDIRQTDPDWAIWKDGTPDGESIDQVYERASQVISKASEVGGDVLLFAHGHLLRILACCYLSLPPRDGRLLALGTAAISVLGWEKETRVIRLWNSTAD